MLKKVVNGGGQSLARGINVFHDGGDDGKANVGQHAVEGRDRHLFVHGKLTVRIVELLVAPRTQKA